MTLLEGWEGRVWEGEEHNLSAIIALGEARPVSPGKRTCGVKEASFFGQKNHTTDARGLHT
jgi:hypothetical protein